MCAMKRLSRAAARRTPAGAPPGVLSPDPDAAPLSVSWMSYDAGALEESGGPDDVGAALAMHGRRAVTWIDVAGLADQKAIGEIGQAFGLHPLAIEDVVNLHQRAKADAFDDHAYIVLQMLTPGERDRTEQVSVFVGADYVLSFQERPGDCLEPVRDRIRRTRGRIRSNGAGYLAYALIDAIVDGYFPELERLGEELEDLEDAVVADPKPDHVEKLHRIKRSLLMLRRAVWPMRDMLNALIRDETPGFGQDVRLYLRDVYDHIVQMIDIIETYREIATGLLDIYLSSQSARMNEIMKVLTIFATIFMPLSFLAGLWGMNFDRASPWNMPELGMRFGYAGALLLMFGVAAGLVVFFYRRGWLSGNAPSSVEPSPPQTGRPETPRDRSGKGDAGG